LPHAADLPVVGGDSRFRDPGGLDRIGNVKFQDFVHAPLTLITHVQLSVLAIVWLQWVLW